MVSQTKWCSTWDGKPIDMTVKVEENAVVFCYSKFDGNADLRVFAWRSAFAAKLWVAKRNSVLFHFVKRSKARFKWQPCHYFIATPFRYHIKWHFFASFWSNWRTKRFWIIFFYKWHMMWVSRTGWLEPYADTRDGKNGNAMNVSRSQKEKTKLHSQIKLLSHYFPFFFLFKENSSWKS